MLYKMVHGMKKFENLWLGDMFGLWMVEVHHRRERFARKSVDLAVTQEKNLVLECSSCYIAL